MDLILEYWYIIVAAIAIVAALIVIMIKFTKKHSSEQVAKVKEWLLVAVLEAERQFGSGTGKLKLRSVYDLFVARFPWIAKIVSFDTFASWVDEALDIVEDWLLEDKIAEYAANK